MLYFVLRPPWLYETFWKYSDISTDETPEYVDDILINLKYLWFVIYLDFSQLIIQQNLVAHLIRKQ